MRLAVFSDPANVSYIRKIFEKYSDKIIVLYVFDRQSVRSVEGKGYYRFDEKADCDYSFLRNYQIDIALVYGWKYLIPVMRLEDISFYNIHPSLLPYYRGPDPVTFQIINKERFCGVTIHKMDEHYDSGPICKQKQFEINCDNDIFFIKMQFLRAVKMLLIDFIEDLLHDHLEFTNQSSINFSYFSYRDLNRYIITNDTSYADFIRIFNTFRGKYPVIVMMDNKKKILSSYSDHEEENSVEYMLDNKSIYLKFQEKNVREQWKS